MFTIIQPWTTKVEALLDLGKPDARIWLLNTYSAIIKDCGVTVFRQDFNIQPANYWRAADTPEREGITEIRFIEGLYEFWDGLLRRHPGLIIDNCASGGRRIDLETIKRSVALHRTDGTGDPEGAQCHTMGLNLFYPCSGAAISTTDAYTFRSCIAAGMSLGFDIYDDNFDADEARKRIKEFEILRPLFYGTFWPLTRQQPDAASDVWCAYQLHRDDLKRGAVLVFRRENSPYSAAALKLRGLQPDCRYELTDVDTGIKTVREGKSLIEKGITLTIPDVRQAAIILYTLLD